MSGSWRSLRPFSSCASIAPTLWQDLWLELFASSLQFWLCGAFGWVGSPLKIVGGHRTLFGHENGGETEYWGLSRTRAKKKGSPRRRKSQTVPPNQPTGFFFVLLGRKLPLRPTQRAFMRLENTCLYIVWVIDFQVNLVSSRNSPNRYQHYMVYESIADNSYRLASRHIVNMAERLSLFNWDHQDAIWHQHPMLLETFAICSR